MCVKYRGFSMLVSRLLMVAVVSAPLVASAAGLQAIVTCGGAGQPACSLCDLESLAQRVLNDGIYIAVFLSAILFAWAGWKLLTSVSNPGERTKAKEIFTNVTIGLVIILSAWLVVDTLMAALTGNHLWSKIC
jgi:hypothetical protein